MSTSSCAPVSIPQPVEHSRGEALSGGSAAGREPELDVVFYSREELHAALSRARDRMAPGDYETVAGMAVWLECWFDLMADPDVTLAQVRERLGVR